MGFGRGRPVAAGSLVVTGHIVRGREGGSAKSLYLPFGFAANLNCSKKKFIKRSIKSRIPRQSNIYQTAVN